MSLYRDEDERVVQAAKAPEQGATESITTVAAAAVKTAAALTKGLYRVSSTVAVSFGRGRFATTVAVAGDSDLPALPHIEHVGVEEGETLSFFDAGAGGGTVKVTKV